MRAELRNPQQELARFQFRVVVAGFLVLAAMGLLFGRFFYLQVVQFSHFHTLAESNRISVVPVVPNRGLILDRNGVVLAHNYSAYTLEITPDQVRNLETTINSLAELIDIQPRDRKRFRKLLEETRNFESLPIRTRLNDEEVARFAAHRYRFPGVDIKARLFRHYPQRELLSHVVGYIGRINERDLSQLEEDDLLANYKGSDHIGKTGLEKTYEKELHGITGFEQVETDAGGRAVRSLSRTPPTTGDDLVLNLDAKLQEVAETAFGDLRGALVALDPRTGGVLAFLSKPGYDPNLFIDGIDSANWDALNNSPDRPLNNRALRGQYPPGSTFKPFMATAALITGKRSPEYSISDPGFFSLPGVAHRYRDWKAGGHGTVNLHKSIVISCDTYYYGLANDMGVDLIHKQLSRFGLGKKTGIDLDGELSGILPSTEWKMKRYRQKWYAGDTVSVGIGQGYVLTTPLQLAQAMAILANGGHGFEPRLVRAVRNSASGATSELDPVPVPGMQIKPEHLALVKQAMVDVTRPGGTAARAGAGAEYVFGGKTGTAQVIGMKQGEKYVESRVAERHRDHALFIAFAPAEAPTIALAVLAENGGHGGSTAAPIARAVLDYHLLGKLPKAPAAAEDAAEERD